MTPLTAQQLRDYLDFAQALAVEAGQFAAASFGMVDARRKFDGSLVTLIDEQTDHLVADAIRAAYPTHGVLSEEQNTIYNPTESLTWVVDPIDGTTNFTRGLPIWGVSIALMQDGHPVVGVLHYPMLHETLTGAAGLGSKRNGSPIQSADTQLPDDESFVMLCTRSQRRYDLRSPLKPRIMGCASYHLAKLADGSALADLEATPKIWDLAAAQVILTEAGGILALQQGGPVFPVPPSRLDYRRHSLPIVAAANDAMYEHIREAMRER